VAAVHNRSDNPLPVDSGFSYSITNCIPAGLISEKGGGAIYPDLVGDRLLEPLGFTIPFC
jgi:CubicO group peptidase (beta-lactamase class C family)